MVWKYKSFPITFFVHCPRTAINPILLAGTPSAGPTPRPPWPGRGVRNPLPASIMLNRVVPRRARGPARGTAAISKPPCQVKESSANGKSLLPSATAGSPSAGRGGPRRSGTQPAGRRRAAFQPASRIRRDKRSMVKWPRGSQFSQARPKTWPAPPRARSGPSPSGVPLAVAGLVPALRRRQRETIACSP